MVGASREPSAQGTAPPNDALPGAAEPLEPLEPGDLPEPPPMPPAASPSPAPLSAWEAPPPAHREVPGAAGWIFAPLGGRLAAYLIDSLVQLAIAVVALIVLLAFLEPTGLEWPAAAFSTGLSYLYFVGFWTGPRRATPGMRLFGIQIGRAEGGTTMSVEGASRRWFALGAPFGLLTGIPAISELAAVGIVGWSIALLVTAGSHPQIQGLHDRFGRSWVVQPADRWSPSLAVVLAIGTVVVLIATVALSGLVLGGAAA